MKKWISILLCTSFLLQGREAFDRLVFLGDDYTDIGNVPGSPFTQTGQNWASILSSKFDFALFPSNQGGTDYAISFSLTGAETLPGANTRLTPVQVNRLDSVQPKSSPVFIWSGTNDMVFQSTVPFSAQQTATNLVNSLQTIHQNGYETLVILNQFDLGRTPQAGIFPLPSASTLSTQSQQINNFLYTGVNQLSFDVFIVDLATLFNDILARPSRYNFTNVTSSAPITVNDSGYLFLAPFGPVQPFTIQFHQILADYIYAAMQGAQFIGHFSEQSLTLLRNQSLTIYQQLYPSRTPPPVGRFIPFVSGNYAFQAEPIMTGNAGTDSHAGNFTLGIMNRFACDWTLGAGWGINLSSLSIPSSNVTCSLNQTANVAVAFLSHSRSRYYITAIGQFAWLRFHNYKRQFYTGPALNIAHGHTTGRAYDVQMTGAVFLYNDPSIFQTGPLLSIDYSQSFIKPLRERGSDIGNLYFNDNHLSSLISGFGWEFRLNKKHCRTHWVLDITAQANYQWLDEDRTIHLREISIPNAPFGGFVIAGDATWFGALGISTSVTLPNCHTFSVGYHLNYGENHIRESVITSSYAF